LSLGKKFIIGPQGAFSESLFLSFEFRVLCVDTASRKGHKKLKEMEWTFQTSTLFATVLGSSLHALCVGTVTFFGG
jgi:hypothetical protein